MKLKKKPNNKVYKIFLVTVIIMTITIFYACRKIDTTVSLNKDLVNKFFQTKGTINPSTQKVLDRIKKDNEKYHNVNSLANNEGLPIWDKALTRVRPISKSIARTTDENTIEEIIVVPLVLEETEYVNSFLAAKISDTIEIKLFSGNDYDNFTFGSLNTQNMTADRLVAQIMLLDKEVFGNTKFKILDNRLFVKPGDSINTLPAFAKLSMAQSPAYGCWATVEEIWWNPDGDECNCSGDEYFHHYQWTWSGSDCNPSFGGTGGGFGFGTGGNGGNGYTGGGGGGSGNHGVIPINENDTPCDPSIATDFATDVNFAAKFRELNSNQVTTLNYEKGYLVNDKAANNYTPLQGNNWSPFIQINNLTTPISGLLHSHFSGGNSIFSPDDILYLAQVYLAGLAKDSTNLFIGMTSKDGDPYLLKVSNPTLFRAFSEKHAKSEKSLQKFSEKYTNPLKSGFNTTDASLNEARFLQMIQNEIGEGMKLYRARDNDCNKWEKLSVDATGNVYSKNCD